MASIWQRSLRLLSSVLNDAIRQQRVKKSGSRARGSKRQPHRSHHRTVAAGAPGGSSPAGTIGEYDTSRGLPAFRYDPQPDGDADPGEVVWTWVPYEEDPTQGKDRPVLVLARDAHRLVIAQLTSKDHDRDAAQEARWGRYWMDIGTGAWDRQRRPSEVRLDRLLWVEPEAIRREGASLDAAMFAKVVRALKAHHRAS
ncbi:MAG: type II toxin-antitoxin system PemK/MazF family toxin [Bowdeniella nasicola]|nr:type II toxin-antitoxin system PemK/MazF family toxin [Bowdeniella nasicola]